MSRRLLFVVVIAFNIVGMLLAQDTSATGADPPAWRPTGDTAAAPAVSPSVPATEPIGSVASQPSLGAVALSNAGQVWREYDISSYTARVTNTKRPEQAIVDWILRDTGYEVWHTDPLGILNAGNRVLRVYHTPEMQKRVADIVERFTNRESATYTFSMRVVTLDTPSWRTQAQRLLQPIPVRTSGVNAWLLPKENAAIILGELQRRSDYREHSSPYLMVSNAQSTVVSAMRARSFVRDIIQRSDLSAGFEQTMGQVDEGFAIDFSPLLTGDRRMVDATIKCEIDQVEKMIPVMIDVATASSPRQRTKIESPQMSHYRFHERFRWPTDQVLLVGLGMVALPIPVDGAPLVQGLLLPIGNSPARANMLIFIECKGPAASNAAATGRPSGRDTKNYRGRY